MPCENCRDLLNPDAEHASYVTNGVPTCANCYAGEQQLTFDFRWNQRKKIKEREALFNGA